MARSGGVGANRSEFMKPVRRAVVLPDHLMTSVEYLPTLDDRPGQAKRICTMCQLSDEDRPEKGQVQLCKRPICSSRTVGVNIGPEMMS